MDPKTRNQLIAAALAGTLGLYVCDVQLNHGRNADKLDIYNWNPAPEVDFSYYEISDDDHAIHASGSLWLTQQEDNSVYQKISDRFENFKDKINGNLDTAKSNVQTKNRAIGDHFHQSVANSKEAAQEEYSAAVFHLRALKEQAKSKHTAASSDIQKQIKEAQNNLDASKKNLKNYGEQAVDDADAHYYDLVNKAKEHAEFAYNKANFDLKNAQSDYESAVANVNSWGKSKQAEAEKRLKLAKAKVESSKNNLANFGKDSVKDAQSKYNEYVEKVKQYYEDLYNEAIFNWKVSQAKMELWGKDVNQKVNKDLEMAKLRVELAKARLTNLGGNTVRSAESKYKQFVSNSKQQAEDSYNQAVYNFKEAQKKSDSTKASWLSELGIYRAKSERELHAAQDNMNVKEQELKHYGDSAIVDAQSNYDKFVKQSKKSAEDHYMRARFNLEQAQQKVDDAQTGASNWRKSKNEEVQANLENAKLNFEESQRNLKQWGEDSMNKAMSDYDDFLVQVKPNIDNHVAKMKSWGEATEEKLRKAGGHAHHKH